MTKVIDPAKVKRVTTAAHNLIGIHEVPDGSNDGPEVHKLQSSTGAYKAPWCVSTGQYIWQEVFGHTLYDDSANAYYTADYGKRHGWVVPHAQAGGHVVYHVGQGHFGTVVEVYHDQTFDAVEGNEGNAVQLVHRDPRTIQCTFIAPPDLYVESNAVQPPSRVIDGVRYYTYKRDVPLTSKQRLAFAEGKGYYAAAKEKK